MAIIPLISFTIPSKDPPLAKEACALAKAGCSVNVVGGDFVSRARDADAEFEGRSSWSVTKVSSGPGPPLPRRSLCLVRQRAARQRVRAGIKFQATVEASWHKVKPDLVKAATVNRADLYVAHYFAVLPAATRAARLHGTRYAFDADDFHFEDPPDAAEFNSVRRPTRSIESAYLPGAGRVKAVLPGFGADSVSAHGIPAPPVVLSVFPRSPSPLASTRRGSANPGPFISSHSQTIGGGRGLEFVIRTVGLARSRPHLYLRENPDGCFLDRVNTVPGTGVRDRLHLLQPGRP